MTEVDAEPTEPSAAVRLDQIVKSLRLNGNTASGCAGYQAAYDQAVDDLQAANAALQEAYNDLYDCQQGGYRTAPTINVAAIEAETTSILTR